MLCAERFPARPVIREGYPKNVTAIENSTVIFECPTWADLEVYVTWAKYKLNNDTDDKMPPNTTVFKVYKNHSIFFCSHGGG